MLRLASALLILTLLSTSVISGTFAKYVTSNSASDTARVAKFGVEIAASGTLFSKTYVNATGGNTPGTANLTVQAAENVVAPGTKSASSGLQIAVTGTPEVTTQLIFDLSSVKDVFLKANTYSDPTTSGDTTDTFELTDDYYPIKFNLTASGSDITAQSGKSFAEIETYLETTLGTKTFEPGTDLSTKIGTITLTWEWPFEVDDATDKADTLLGDIAAGTPSADITGLEADSDYCLTENLSISVTITQVD